MEAPVPATTVARVPDVAQCLHSTSELLSEWAQEDLDTWGLVDVEFNSEPTIPVNRAQPSQGSCPLPQDSGE